MGRGSWRCSWPGIDAIPFVIPSTNEKAARELAGRDEPVLEILGRPFDLDELLAAVQRVSGTRPRQP